MKRTAAVLSCIAWLAAAACGGAPSTPPVAAVPEPTIVDLGRLEAAVKQARGRGTLVNMWATW